MITDNEITLPQEVKEKLIARCFVDLGRIEKGEIPLFQTKEYYDKYPLLKEDYDNWRKKVDEYESQ